MNNIPTIDQLTNHFLIAMPGLDGSFFERTVTYICEHNNTGAMGLVINRSLKINLHDILAELNIQPDNLYLRNIPVVAGGPVNHEVGFIVHRDEGHAWKNTFHPAKDIAVTTSSDMLTSIAKQNQPIDACMMLGYAGWEEGQLETELLENDWLACPADSKLIFNTPVNERWEAALQLLGLSPAQLYHRSGWC